MSTKEHERKARWILWISILLAAAAVVAAILARWRRRRIERPPRERPPAPPAIPPSLRGLTEAEAEARRLEGQDNSVRFRPARSRRDILQDNLYTVFNLSLVGLATAQFLLGLPLDGLLSLGMILVNAALNIGQELFARIRLKEVEEATRPQATVLREGRVRSIDTNEVVLGDMLVVGPGDTLLVDGELLGEGQLVVDERMLTGKSARVTKHAGDKAYSGTFCVSGRAVCEAQKVGDERLIARRLASSQAGKEELTALERVIDSILRVLLVVVGVLTVFLLARYFRLDTGIPVDAFASAASVIFSIAPASLFFMIFLTYAAGTADLAKLGALVYRARSVESLAQATTICFARAGILTGTHVEVDTIEPPADQERLAESRIHQILGDYVHSTSMDNLVTRAMASTFEGSRRIVLEEAPFLSVYGWSAIAVDDDDLRGVYVLGDPEVLEDHLVTGTEEPAEEEAETTPLGALRKRLTPLGRFLRRSEAETQDGEAAPVTQREKAESSQPPPPESKPPSDESGSQETEASSAPEEEAPKRNLFRRVVQRARSILPGARSEPKETEEEEPEVEETVLLFAYRPEVNGLHASDGSPQLPQELIPLCHLRYSERVRPEAIETIHAFSETGVSIKIFSSHAPQQTAAVLKQAGLGADDEMPLRVISGAELADMDPEQLGRAVDENTVFGYISPEQAGRVVQTLREQGQAVAMVGDDVNDVPAMRQANLAVARRGSSQAGLSVADIVLLKDSPKVLLDILGKGQRIVNGLLDVLRLYLTQMLYLTLLIVAIRVVAYGFPYQSKQGSIIGIVTLSLPAVGLSLWAASGLLSTKNLRWLLARFVAPAALTITAAGLLVYLFFLARTDDVAYAQLTLTYTLVAIGLLLVLFLRPPTRLWRSAAQPSGGLRFTVVVIILLAAFLLLPAIPLARELFLLDWLRQPTDYAIVGMVVLGWAVVLRVVLWAVPLVAKEEQAAPVPGASSV